MLPRRGSICGRLTQDLPLGCLQGGRDRGAVAEAELAADGLDARGGVDASQSQKSIPQIYRAIDAKSQFPPPLT